MNSLRCCRRLLRAVLLVSLSYCLLLVMCAPAGSAQRRERWQWPTLSPVPVASSFAPPVHDWLPGRRGVTLTYPGGSTRVRVRLRNGDVRGPGRRARGYLDPARDARAHHLVDLSTSDAERERRRYRHDGRADRRCRGRIADPALGSEDRTENVRRSDPVDGRQAAAPALEWELTRTRRVPCTRSSGDHHR